ncbi:MAG: VIT1/CCC1 transporter family protein [Candidatus Falkowbacteria bacterium]|nr:VIT1/CCC1 transporter family protein [Candidatus Falkowbacteria bacterium]
MHVKELSQVGKKSSLADIILGGQDGLVNVLGVILGVAAATSDHKIIIAAGMAATFAESISMAAVALTSKMAERDHYYSEVEREKREIKEMPEVERAEIREIYAQKGFSGKLLEDIVAQITSNNEQWLKFMMKEELELTEIKNKEIYTGSFVVGFSALVGSFVPLLPFFFLPIKTAVISSLIISAIVLLFVGIYKAKTTVGNPLKTGLQMVLIGMGAALAGYFIGHLFGQ